jgi:hypothetical protein
MNRPNKLDCSIPKLETLTSDKCSNLLEQFLSYEENEVLWIRTLISKLAILNKKRNNEIHTKYAILYCTKELQKELFISNRCCCIIGLVWKQVKNGPFSWV